MQNYWKIGAIFIMNALWKKINTIDQYKYGYDINYFMIFVANFYHPLTQKLQLLIY